MNSKLFMLELNTEENKLKFKMTVEKVLRDITNGISEFAKGIPMPEQFELQGGTREHFQMMRAYQQSVALEIKGKLIDNITDLMVAFTAMEDAEKMINRLEKESGCKE